MAVVNLVEGRSAETLQTEWLTRSDSRVFSVLVDDASTGKDDASNAPGLPPMGSFWRNMRANSIIVHPTKSAYLFDVEVRYETQFYSPTESIEDPFSTPIDIEWSFIKEQDYIEQDIYWQPITNSAGFPPDPALTEDKILQVGTAVRNEVLFDRALARAYMNKLNADEWCGWEPGKVKVDDIRARRVFDKRGFVYWQVTYVFVCNELGWKRRIRDEGYYLWEQNADGTWEAVPIKDKEGNPITEPMALDGNGGVLPKGSDYVWLEFETKDSIAFGPLQLQ